MSPRPEPQPAPVPAPGQAPPSASTSAPDPSTFVRVRTTLPRLPLPPMSARLPVTTARLLIRPVAATDLEALHVLRTQPEVMKWTLAGRVDADLDETRAKLDNSLPQGPEGEEKNENFFRTYQCAICLRETGELIGTGGVHNWRSLFGWPELGYMFRREFWGAGLAPEFVAGFVGGVWERLEREQVVTEVDRRTVVIQGVDGGLVQGSGDGNGDGVLEVPEQLIAITAEENGKSQRVLQKSGFEWFLTWQDEDSAKPGSGELIRLPTYRYFPGSKKVESGTTGMLS